MENRKAVIVGISGASSSGKTTLARLLRDVFPNTFVLHEDDFYKPEAKYACINIPNYFISDRLPIRDGLVDWDCPEALCIPDMIRALSHIRKNGTFPPFVDSKEDQNSIGACPVSDAKIAAMRAKVQAWLAPGQPGHAIFSPPPPPSSSPPPPRVCLLDGFLLYTKPEMAEVMRLLDVRLFLLVSRARATARREARDGYVTLEGFWKDPPGYVDKIVWPNYVAAHAWLFEGGDVEKGRLDEGALRESGILAAARAAGDGNVDVDMETTFEWAVERLMEQLERIYGAGKR
ncbi:ribosylnicotinamide kinase [Diatrype stigma]|uniref:Ribosylnicotinamide kinase n=1 Tax=Diatrype stigma TaxID=117547 RepID=A0AAN9V2I1_9PEZI